MDQCGPIHSLIRWAVFSSDLNPRSNKQTMLTKLNFDTEFCFREFFNKSFDFGSVWTRSFSHQMGGAQKCSLLTVQKAEDLALLVTVDGFMVVTLKVWHRSFWPEKNEYYRSLFMRLSSHLNYTPTIYFSQQISRIICIFQEN